MSEFEIGVLAVLFLALAGYLVDTYIHNKYM